MKVTTNKLFSVATDLEHVKHPCSPGVVIKSTAQDKALGVFLFVLTGLLTVGIMPIIYLATAYKKIQVLPENSSSLTQRANAVATSIIHEEDLSFNELTDLFSKGALKSSSHMEPNKSINTDLKPEIVKKKQQEQLQQIYEKVAKDPEEHKLTMRDVLRFIFLTVDPAAYDEPIEKVLIGDKGLLSEQGITAIKSTYKRTGAAVSNIKELHDAGLKTIKDLITYLKDHHHSDEFIDELAAYVDRWKTGWYKTTEKLQPPTHVEPLQINRLSDEELLSTLRNNPLLVFPFPQRGIPLLEQLTMEECASVLTQAPDLFHLFPTDLQNKFLAEINSTAQKSFNDMPSTYQKALIALIEYPPCWNLLTSVAEESRKQALDHSTVFSSLKKSLESQDEALNHSINWNELSQFVLGYPSTASEIAQERISKLFLLQRDYWKLFIDPRYHSLGKEVFDKGLHHGEVEPGYLNSMQGGLILLCYGINEMSKPESEQHFDRSNLFLSLHRALMQHHKSVESLLTRDAFNEEITIHLNAPRIPLSEAVTVLEEIKRTTTNLHFTPDALEYYSGITTQLEKGLSLVLEPISKLELAEHLTRISTNLTTGLAKASLPEEQRDAVAAYHQALERTHPFRDGNSRTDILMLQFELILAGQNPSLLEPNDSYLVSQAAWSQKIKEGQEEFRKQTQ
jgi:hypothetical protein